MNIKTYRFVFREYRYEENDLPDTEVMDYTQAAREIGISVQSIHNAMKDGRLTEVIDIKNKTRHQRRHFALVSEVNLWKKRGKLRTENGN